MTIAKTRIGDCSVGVPCQFRLDVSNLGDAPAGMVTVIDPLPDRLTLVSASGVDWDCSGSTIDQVLCVYDGVPPLAPMTSLAPITVIVNVLPGDGAVIVNTAVVETDGELNTSNNTDSAFIDLTPPAPAPALSTVATVLAFLALCGVALVAMRRRIE